MGVASRAKPARTWGVLLVGIGIGLGALYYFAVGRNPEPRRHVAALSLHEMQTAASVSVGRVNRVEMSGTRSNLGIAVAIEEGVMMAPCQGMEPGAQLLVRIPPRDIPAQVKRTDEALGLCRLAVSGAGSWPLPMSSVLPRVGDKVYAANLGPLGEVVITPGEVKTVVSAARGHVIDSTARAGPPAEGSPLLDIEGRIVAVALGGEHTTLPRSWVVDSPSRSRPLPAKPAEGATTAARPRVPADARGKKPDDVPPEKREALEKAFRPPPSVPKDL